MKPKNIPNYLVTPINTYPDESRDSGLKHPTSSREVETRNFQQSQLDIKFINYILQCIYQRCKMSLFGKKENPASSVPQLPKLPILPRLPERPSSPTPAYNDSQVPLKEFPTLDQSDNPQDSYEDEKEIHQLPSFPTNQFEEKFSQNTIKNAISGRDKMTNVSNRIPGENLPEMSHPIEGYQIAHEPMEKNPELEKRFIPKDEDEEEVRQPSTKREKPIFIRIDKFEESLKIFEKTKDKISEIEHLLKETKELKKKEQAELSIWEEEIQKLKLQIEKVDQDIFSKIE